MSLLREQTLAINGGKPVRENEIRYGRQWIDQEDINAMVEPLYSDFLTTGPQVDALEYELCNFLHSKYCTVVSSGTAALHVACMAIGIGPGDEVITTPLTFAASANCILYCGGTPVFADVDPDTYCIDPDSIRKCITPRTKAIIAVDYTGQSVKIDEIKAICDEYNLVFIEDAAHSIGTRYKGQMIGSLADITCFSFHPVKTITSGEGGAITTNNEYYYRKISILRSHGIEHDRDNIPEDMYEGSWVYDFNSLGYNYRMTDFQAALLRNQLRKIEKFKSRRTQIEQAYRNAFENIPEIILQKLDPDSDTCRHLFILRINLNMLTCTRKMFIESMIAEGVHPQVHYIPVYWFTYYRRLGYKKGLCPIAESIYSNMMSIPLFPKMSDYDMQSVINIVTKLIGAYRRDDS